MDAIREVYREFKGRYGSPRIALELCKRGIFTSKNHVARHMQRMGLVALPWRRKHRLGREPSGELWRIWFNELLPLRPKTCYG
ncbi:IS3 family transposase [Alicyclobacillus kakegawensis]|uniref:IS3 family transposase n=1 Tax=Alicyclobacillus kakegawensis TaxID=392012 RepID=UPI0009FA5805